jgi:hypothetical protein
MCAKWTVKNEIMGQLLFLYFPLLAAVVSMIFPFSFNHPYWSIVGFVGVVIVGGVYLWKRKR